jgi:hypothetical protein
MFEEARDWLGEVAPIAEVEHRLEDHGWWIKVAPHRHGACPFTIGLADNGDYDLFAGDLFSQEGWPWPDGVAAGDLCRAIAAGRVTEREWRSQWLNLPVRSIATIEIAPDQVWSDEYRLLLPLPRAWCDETERRYQPYREPA